MKIVQSKKAIRYLDWFMDNQMCSEEQHTQLAKERLTGFQSRFGRVLVTHDHHTIEDTESLGRV